MNPSLNQILPKLYLMKYLFSALLIVLFFSCEEQNELSGLPNSQEVSLKQNSINGTAAKNDTNLTSDVDTVLMKEIYTFLNTETSDENEKLMLSNLKQGFDSIDDVKLFTVKGLTDNNIGHCYLTLLLMKKYSYLDSLLTKYSPTDTYLQFSKKIEHNFLRYQSNCDKKFISDNMELCEKEYLKTKNSTFLLQKYSQMIYLGDTLAVLEEIDSIKQEEPYVQSDIFWNSVKQFVEENPNGVFPVKYNNCVKL